MLELSDLLPQNIIGIDTKTPAKAENKLRVKDLTIYPLPIVRADMSVYELLNLFQLGMSRYCTAPN